VTARGAIVEKGVTRRKVIGEYLSNCSEASVGAHEHREAAIAFFLIHRYRGLAVLVRSYRKYIDYFFAAALTWR
jgi:hypothetical protein